MSDANHSVIDVIATPCGAGEKILGAENDNINEDCNWDKKVATDYLNDFNVVTYYNLGRFAPKIFEGLPIERKSNVHQMRAD